MSALEASAPAELSPVKHDIICADRLRPTSLRLLARIFQLLDTDRDGLLDEDEAKTFLVSASTAPSAELMSYIRNRVPRSWRDKGFDFDTLVSCIEELLIVDPLTDADLRTVFGPFETNKSVDTSLLSPSKDKAHAALRPSIPPDTGRGGKGAVPAYSFRHILSGIPTAERSQLTMYEVDTVFQDLGVLSERQRMDYVEALRLLSDGFLNVVKEPGAPMSR